jgi:hypothetical protein
MKRLIQYFACAAMLTMSLAASAQETDNINNRYGPPTYTGGTVATPSETFAVYQQQTANYRSVYQRNTAAIVTVYPNPSATYTRIVLAENTTQPVTVSVITLNGVLVRSYEYSAGSGRFDIDISSLPEGIYALQVQERGKTAQSIQLSKIRS